MANSNKKKDAKQKIYSFPTISSCPRCGSIDTQATSTQGKVQYRQCRRIGCRDTYHVIGTEVKRRKIETINKKTKKRKKTNGKSKRKKTIKRKSKQNNTRTSKK